MSGPEDFPYCFWHPDVPHEQTLRHLVDKYPDNKLLRYSVGRACAAITLPREGHLRGDSS
ncbi:hypothetical protein BDV59DRAFT_169855 [Aspergillus ambiguus]|uniref:uncharacterized protein n=1 Tax=Aspergillus ambiguus TaxID=176160 RepID=UPI003CCC9ED4